MKKYIVEVYDGGYVYWQNEAGEFHRLDGPAFIAETGFRAWIIHNEYHREDGPAVEYANGSRFWYNKGKCHREDGPAVEYANGTREWYLNGKRLTKEEFNNRNKPS